MSILNPKLTNVGATNDPIDGIPGANGTWAKLIAGGATTDSAFADAGYIEFPGVDGSGNALTLRIPCVKVA